jgi:hypothetical protein
MQVVGLEYEDGDGELKGGYTGCEAGVTGGVGGDGGEVRARRDAADDEAREGIGGEMGTCLLGELGMGDMLDGQLGGRWCWGTRGVDDGGLSYIPISCKKVISGHSKV